MIESLGPVASDAVQEKFSQLHEHATEYYVRGRDKVRQADRDVEQFIRDRPLKAVLIAAGAGMLLGGYWMCRYWRGK